MSDKLCLCGSGQSRQSLFDARGIFCCYVCDICKVSKASRYRIEVLEAPNYDHDEEIDDDTALDREFHDAFDKD
jgi:hypothetical protein